MSLDLISSVNSLTLTIVVLGFGYLSILTGYFLAGKQDEFFSGKLDPIDKTTLSFIIGGISLISYFSLFGFNLVLLENFYDIIIYQILLLFVFSIVIALILKSGSKEN